MGVHLPLTPPPISTFRIAQIQANFVSRYIFPIQQFFIALYIPYSAILYRAIQYIPYSAILYRAYIPYSAILYCAICIFPIQQFCITLYIPYSAILYRAIYSLFSNFVGVCANISLSARKWEKGAHAHLCYIDIVLSKKSNASRAAIKSK